MLKSLKSPRNFKNLLKSPAIVKKSLRILQIRLEHSKIPKNIYKFRKKFRNLLIFRNLAKSRDRSKTRAKSPLNLRGNLEPRPEVFTTF